MRVTKRSILVLAASLILALTMGGTAMAATWTVDDDGFDYSGADFTTIQAAINAASPGDSIDVYPGTYDPEINALPPGWGGSYPVQGIVVWKNNLTIKAVNGPSNTIIASNLGAWMDPWRIQYLTGGVFTNPPGSPLTLDGGFNPGTSASPNAVMIVASGCTIDGFTIQAHPSSTGGGYNGSGVLIGGVAPGDSNSLGADNNVVKNCVFNDVWQAVYIWHSSGNQVLDNTVATLGNTGAWAGITIYDGSTNDQIDFGHLSLNNVIQGNSLADKGISVGAWQPTKATDNSGTNILNNTVYGDIGFFYTASTGIKISGNTVQSGRIIFSNDSPNSFTSCEVSGNSVLAGVGNGIQLHKMTGGSVSGNTVTGRTTNGIALLRANGVAITGNTATDNGASGIVIADSSTGVTVTENRILRNAGDDANPGGLTIKGGASDTTVLNNTINNNTRSGVCVYANAGTGNVFHLNCIVNNGLGMDNRLATVADAENNWWGNESGPYNAAGNSQGTGNAANDTSDFDPWITGLKYTGGTFFTDPTAVLLEAMLVNSDGDPLAPTPLPGVTVEFQVDGNTEGTVTTDSGGVAQLTVSLDAGTHAVKAVVTGGVLLGNCLAGCEATGSIEVAPDVDLAVAKSGPVWLHLGDPITYTYEVTNPGNVSVAPTLVDDLGTPSDPSDDVNPEYVSGDDNGNGLVDPGETWVYTFTYTPAKGTGDNGSFFNNVLTNTATVTPVDGQDGNPSNNSDTYTLAMWTLRKDVLLYFQGHNVNYSDLNTEFTVEIYKLNADGVTKDLLGTFTIKESDPAELWLSEGKYYFKEINVPAGYTPARDWWSLTESGPNHRDMSFENLIRFDLAVQKTGPATAAPGETITYHYTVTNTGPAAVTPVLSDDKAGTPIYDSGDTNLDGKIQPTETWLYHADYLVPTDAAGTSIVNVVTVKDAEDDYGDGWKVGGDTNLANNTATWTVPVTAPSTGAKIQLVKTACPGTVPEFSGALVTYTFKVTNTGTVPVTLTKIYDDVYGVIYAAGRLPIVLAPGASKTFVKVVCYMKDVGTYTNVATATAVDSSGRIVSATDDATVTVTDVKPKICVTKKASVTSVPYTGGWVTYTVTVKNSGGEPITLTKVVDDKLGVIYDGAPITLAAGGSKTFTVKAWVSGAKGTYHVNTVTATASDNEGNEVSAAATAKVLLSSCSPSPWPAPPSPCPVPPSPWPAPPILWPAPYNPWPTPPSPWPFKCS